MGINTEKLALPARRIFAHPNTVAMGILLLVTLLFFWPLILGGDWHIPKGGGDLESFLWPTYRYATQTLRSGTLPLWNPYLHSGAPYAADNQSGLFYPPNLLMALLPDLSYRAMEWLVAIHIFLAGAGMYFASKQHYPHAGIHPPLAASVAFQLSSIFITHIGNLNIVATSAFLPWAWLCLLRMDRSRSYSSAATLAIILSLSVLVGHAQMALVISLAVSLASLWILGSRPAKTQWIVLCATALALTIGLCAFFIIPTIELTQYSLRAGLNYEQATRYSVPAIGIPGIFSPLLFGRGPLHFWPTWDRVELGYCGVITILLAIIGSRHHSHSGILLLLATFGILVALGPATPIHSVMYNYMPGFTQIRVPARFLLLTNFALSMLACSGLNRWQKALVSRNHILISTLVLGSLIAFTMPLGWYLAAAQLPDKAPQTLLIALTVALTTLAIALVTGPRWITLLLSIELIGLGAWIEVDRLDPYDGFRSTPAVELLQAQPSPFRIDVAASTWQQDAPVIHRLEAINGLYNPMGLSNYDRYYWSVGHRGSPQYNFLNAKYLITDKGKPAADGSFIPVFDADPLVDIYLNTNAQPRISLVYHSIHVKNEAEAFDAIHKPNFDPTQVVVIENGANLSSKTPNNSMLHYNHYSAHYQAVEAVTPSPAYLVFSEVWYPGWEAKLNGKTISLLRANYAFRAVYLPPGKHIVELNFSPNSWQYASSLSLATIILLTVCTLTSIYRKRTFKLCH